MFKNPKISHAVAYCEVFMRAHDFGEYPELDTLRNGKGQNVLTADEVVNIIRENVRYSDVSGRALILDEMHEPAFREYVHERFKTREQHDSAQPVRRKPVRI